MTTLLTKMNGKLEAEYFHPSEEATAAQFAREHGLVLYTLTTNGGIQLEENPIPGVEVAGFIALVDVGETIELESPPPVL